MAIRLEMDASVATVTIDRPDKLNAVNEDMKADLTRLFSELGADPTVRAIVLTGAGRNFCAGGDVGTMAKVTPVSGQRRLATAQGVIKALATVERPVIAAVRGPVAGMGCGFALASDLVVASETTVFHFSFKRIGLAPDGGTVFFLRQFLGPAKAKELFYFGRPLPAAEALELGLINKVVPDGQLESEARKMALELAVGPTFALALTKRMFRSIDTPSLESYLEIEAGLQGLAQLSSDHAEGAASFREKRAPKFIGS